MATEIKVVAIYSPEDTSLWQALKVFISAMQRQGLLNIALWDLGEISAGTESKKVLAQWINEADLILLLLSPDLFAKDVFDSSSLILQRNALSSVSWPRYCGVEELGLYSTTEGESQHAKGTTHI